MNCTDTIPLIGAYVDGETSRTEGNAIRQHMATCPECAAKRDSLLNLRSRLRAEVPHHAAPDALRARVEAMLENARPKPTPPRRTLAERWRWLTAGAVAGCAATMLSWFVGTSVVAWRTNEDIAMEAVTSHVRATLANHRIQVASSDQHTVKPWLSARLDYSPPVPDPQADGITLVGGRIDYLDRRPVATLVYKLRDHNIDVFVRPESSRTTPSELRTIRGFNIAHANGAAMDWLAVSDASPDVLAAFVQRLARDAQPR